MRKDWDANRHQIESQTPTSRWRQPSGSALPWQLHIEEERSAECAFDCERPKLDRHLLGSAFAEISTGQNDNENDSCRPPLKYSSPASSLVQCQQRRG